MLLFTISNRSGLIILLFVCPVSKTWSPKWSPTKCLYSAQSNSAPVAAGPPVTKANNIVKKTECFKNLRAECLKRWVLKNLILFLEISQVSWISASHACSTHSGGDVYMSTATSLGHSGKQPEVRAESGQLSGIFEHAQKLFWTLWPVIVTGLDGQTRKNFTLVISCSCAHVNTVDPV